MAATEGRNLLMLAEMRGCLFHLKKKVTSLYSWIDTPSSLLLSTHYTRLSLSGKVISDPTSKYLHPPLKSLFLLFCPFRSWFSALHPTPGYFWWSAPSADWYHQLLSDSWLHIVCPRVSKATNLSARGPVCSCIDFFPEHILFANDTNMWN